MRKEGETFNASYEVDVLAQSAAQPVLFARFYILGGLAVCFFPISSLVGACVGCGRPTIRGVGPAPHPALPHGGVPPVLGRV